MNTIELGKHGRYRTNVWDYAGANSFRSGRDAELEMHPTVKPTALVIDAIKDCSRRGDIVLDPFSGSGTTIMAAQKCRRRARAIELDPLYVDVAIRRWQTYTGQTATMAITGGELRGDRAAPRGSSSVGRFTEAFQSGLSRVPPGRLESIGRKVYKFW
ncbi:site-specific DNA-methyltransferase [Bradyrhizobium sp. 138]|uniref:DNA-methyltransferase n=1 Tax=Bradyrhizobium sp. 138 TaxID=2782615 RepID=UPI003208997F